VLDARVSGGGEHGGIEQVVIGLAGGLSQLADGDEEYVFLTFAGDDDWLRPYLGANSKIHSVSPPWGRAIMKRVAITGPWLVPLYYAWRRKTGPISSSDGTIEALGADVIHFTFQKVF